MSSGASATDPLVYGDYTNAHVLNKGNIIEIILNNNDAGKHPFHLHGHNFQVVHRTGLGAGIYTPSDNPLYPETPMRRDVLMVRPKGNFVIRFKADNPGESG